MKPEHGSVSLSMPAYVSWIAAGPCGATLHVDASRRPRGMRYFISAVGYCDADGRRHELSAFRVREPIRLAEHAAHRCAGGAALTEKPDALREAFEVQ